MPDLSERELRILVEMKECVHFNGIQRATCKAGVNYRELVGGPDFGWALKIPCGPRMSHAKESPVPCANLTLPTREMAEQEIDKQDAIIAQIEKDLREGRCPHCHQEAKHRQVGPCVYGVPCGHRLYQGKANPKFLAGSAEQSGVRP